MPRPSAQTKIIFVKHKIKIAWSKLSVAKKLLFAHQKDGEIFFNHRKNLISKTILILSWT